MNLSLDTTGLSLANFISSEQHAVSPLSLGNFGYITLNNPLFFGRGLVVRHMPHGSSGASVLLTQGIDYVPLFELPGFGDSVATKVWGGLGILNTQINGIISVSYRALGGNWTMNAAAIQQYLSTNTFDAQRQRVVTIPSAPLYLPNNPSVIWPVNSVVSVVIAQAQMTNIDLSVAFEALPTNPMSADSGVLGSASNPNSTNVINFPAQQHVITTSLPLPENAAMEVGGNLALTAAQLTNLRASVGGIGDALWQGSGAATIVSILKGIYALCASISTSNTKQATVYSQDSGGVPITALHYLVGSGNGQTLLPARPNRSSLRIQNTSASSVIWINPVTMFNASHPGWRLNAGESIDFGIHVPTTEIRAMGDSSDGAVFVLEGISN